MALSKGGVWKAVVVVVLLAAAGVIAFINLRGDKVQPDDVNYICVATGKTFSIPRGGVRVMPLENPETKDRTLVPIYEKDGAFFVSDRNRETLKALGEKNKFVDVATMKVKPTKP